MIDDVVVGKIRGGNGVDTAGGKVSARDKGGCDGEHGNGTGDSGGTRGGAPANNQ